MYETFRTESKIKQASEKVEKFRIKLKSGVWDGLNYQTLSILRPLLILITHFHNFFPT